MLVSMQNRAIFGCFEEKRGNNRRSEKVLSELSLPFFTRPKVWSSVVLIRTSREGGVERQDPLISCVSFSLFNSALFDGPVPEVNLISLSVASLPSFPLLLAGRSASPRMQHNQLSRSQVRSPRAVKNGMMSKCAPLPSPPPTEATTGSV